MNLMKKFFEVQMGLDVCPPAREKLLKKIMPRLCIENDICPVCSGDLEIFDDINAAYVNSTKKCKTCKMLFKGEKSYGRPHIEPTPFIRQK